jgi:hypothetical protein
MDDVTRRQAIKAAAAAGAVALAAGSANAQEEKAKGQGRGRDDGPIGGEITLGSRESYRLTGNAVPTGSGNVAVVSNNCDEKKREIDDRFTFAEFGLCNHPTTVDADAVALSVLLPQVIAQGGVLNLESGHRAVTYKGPLGSSWTLYLSYAGGDPLFATKRGGGDQKKD